MKIWNLVLITALLTFQNLSANSVAATSSAMMDAESVSTLKLNSPSDLHIEQVSTDWADLAWTPVPGAAQYIINTIDIVSGNQVHSITVQGNSSMAQITWPDFASGRFSSTIASIDGNGNQSPPSNALSVDKVILELVTTGYILNQSPTNACTLGISTNSCSKFTWGQAFETTYRVVFNSTPPEFFYTIKGYIGANNTPHIALSYLSEGAFGCTLTPDKCRFQITQNGIIIATLGASQITMGNGPSTTFIGNLWRYITESPLCVITKLGVASGRPAPTNEWDEKNILSSSYFSASPNPFNDALTVQLPETNNPIGTTVRLYDLLGSVKRSYTASADQNELTLNTVDLTPGVYFLRIESDGHFETIKVLKTQ